MNFIFKLFRSRRHSQHPPQSHQLPTTITAASFESTVAVYTYLDEELPYRSKLPGSQPTLRQFKEYLPKKGNFRLVFTCYRHSTQFIQNYSLLSDQRVFIQIEFRVFFPP